LKLNESELFDHKARAKKAVYFALPPLDPVYGHIAFPLTIAIRGILETEFAVTVIIEAVVTGVCAVDEVEKRIAGQQAHSEVLTARAATAYAIPTQALHALTLEALFTNRCAGLRDRVRGNSARFLFTRVGRAGVCVRIPAESGVTFTRELLLAYYLTGA